MEVILPLYGIPEAGTHWFKTYYGHHCDNLDMAPSTYDPCLLVSTKNSQFGIVGMQTDDTLGLADEAFSIREDEELVKAKLMAKPKEELSANTELTFNGAG
jgi:hypothetical protein